MMKSLNGGRYFVLPEISKADLNRQISNEGKFAETNHYYL